MCSWSPAFPPRCLFRKYTASRMAWHWADVVGATLVVARDGAGTRPAPTGAGLVKWTSRYAMSIHLIELLAMVAGQSCIAGPAVFSTSFHSRLPCAHLLSCYGVRCFLCAV